MRFPTVISAIASVSIILSGCAIEDELAGESIDTEAEETVEAPPHVLQAGMCLNDVSEPLASALTEIPDVPCDEPHESEVFSEIALDGDDFPGVDAVNDLAATQCEAAFGDFVGLDYRVSELSFHYYYPTFSRWAEGDRTIYCVVFDPAGDTTGSLRAVAR